MTQTDKQSIEKLRNEYLNIVKAGLHLQEKGDLKAYTLNALRAESIAQKLQAVSRSN